MQQATPLVLRDYQVPHFEKIMSILDRQFFCVDGSEMGLGKTVVSIKVAMARALPLVVVAPVAARAVWFNELNKYQCPYYNLHGGPVLTYEGLRGTAAHHPHHGLLTRSDVTTLFEGKMTTITTFQPTPMLNAMIDAGVLFIFDESHNIKNTSDQTDAARAIIGAIYARGGRSRFMLNSGTAMDKAEQVITFLRTIMFIRHRALYTLINGVLKMTGIAELNEWALRINPDAARLFIATRMSPAPRTKAAAHKYVTDMFLEVLKPWIMSIMVRPANKIAEKDIRNCYYSLAEDNNNRYRQGLVALSRAVRYDPTTGSVTQSKRSMGDVTKALIQIQEAKVPAMIRVARQLLSTPDENGLWRKVILFADYIRAPKTAAPGEKGVIEQLMEGLKDFAPLELTGRISEKKRAEIVAKFQETNHTHRLLIAHPKVGGIAISLHDLDGRFPRYMLIMPGYRINELHQATGRIYRDGVKGTARIRFFYGLSGDAETSILSALMRKGKFMGALHSEQKEGGMIFPDEYPTDIEAGASREAISDISSAGALSPSVDSSDERGDFDSSPELASPAVSSSASSSVTSATSATSALPQLTPLAANSALPQFSPQSPSPLPSLPSLPQLPQLPTFQVATNSTLPQFSAPPSPQTTLPQQPILPSLTQQPTLPMINMPVQAGTPVQTYVLK